jgi:tetratricopeptide (TPR) repeat protein
MKNAILLFALILAACQAAPSDSPAEPTAMAVATETVAEATATATPPAEELVQSAQDAANRGDWAGAVTMLDQAIAQNPNLAQAFLLRGNAYRELGDNALALADYDQAIALDVNLATAFHNRGLLHSEAGNTEQALADFARAIELSPTFGLAYRNRAQLHLQLGNDLAAALDLQIYLTFVPNAPDRATVEQQIADLQQEVAQEAEEDGLLFFDDFSDTSSGWYTNGDPASPGLYAGDGYVLHKKQANGAVWAMPGRLFNDVRVEVFARKQAGAEDSNYFGVMCRIQGTGESANFYFMIISSDGYYGIGKSIAGEGELIANDLMLYSSQILQGEVTNSIMAICDGDYLALYVNGVKLAETNDDELSSGQVGLMVGTFDEAGANVIFDDFTVYQP